MKRFITPCLLLLLANACFAAGLPKELKPQYQGLIKAMTTLDSKTYRSYFAEDFVSVDPKGKESNRAEFFQLVNGIFISGKSARMAFTPGTSSTKDGAISESFDATITVMRKSGGTIVVHEVGTDTWKKIKGIWLRIKTVDTVLDIKITK